jgi:hypothetical protein
VTGAGQQQSWRTPNKIEITGAEQDENKIKLCENGPIKNLKNLHFLLMERCFFS